MYRLQLKSPDVLTNLVIYLHILLIYKHLTQQISKVILSTNKVFSPPKRTLRNHCIMWHSLRYFRYSGSVICMSKLPVPLDSMPCESRILHDFIVMKLWSKIMVILRSGLIPHYWQKSALAIVSRHKDKLSVRKRLFKTALNIDYIKKLPKISEVSLFP